MHTLIATDGSDVSIDAARHALELLAPGKVTLLSVADTAAAVDTGAGGFAGNLLTPEEAERARDAILAEGKDELRSTRDAVSIRPEDVELRLVEGSAGPAICQVADELDVDLIIVGSHGRGFLQRILLGSVSEFVVRHAKQPVLVVRHEATKSSDDE